MKRAVIYLRTFHHLPPDMVAQYGEPKVSPFDMQERACRAYCDRMGYVVVGVHRATTPPPQDVTPHLRIRIAPEPVTAYWGYDSRHPYYLVKNLLAQGQADVRVEVHEAGPGGSVWANAAPEVATLLDPYEYASRWEIEPPSELERHVYDLVQRLKKVDGEEERAVLVAQLDAAADQLDAVQQPLTPAPTAEPGAQPEAPMACYACGARPARPASAFCSVECAQAAAERLVRASTHRWCAACARWVGPNDCPHPDQQRPQPS